MAKHAFKAAALDQPLDYTGVIEGTLLNGFPNAWEGTYFYDPARNRSPETEGHVIYTMISPYIDGGEKRGLQNFSNDVTRAIREGKGKVIPLLGRASKKFCYLMGELPEKEKPPRLLEFFGADALVGQDLVLLARLFDEFVVRHEMGHSIKMFSPLCGEIQTRADEERLCDTYAVLGMMREHGDIILPFTETVIKGRIWQDNTLYDTSGVLADAILAARENGTRSLRSLTEIGLFNLALGISNPQAVKSRKDIWGTGEKDASPRIITPARRPLVV